MGSHWVLFLLYLNVVLSCPEYGPSRPKLVAKYNLIVIIASCLDVCCVLTVHNILYKFIDIYIYIYWWCQVGVNLGTFVAHLNITSGFWRTDNFCAWVTGLRNLKMGSDLQGLRFTYLNYTGTLCPLYCQWSWYWHCTC